MTACHVADITLKELIGAKKEHGSEVAIPEVRVGQDVGTVQDDSQRGRFCGVFIFKGLGVIKCLHAVATCGLRCWGSKVECPVWGIFGLRAGGCCCFQHPCCFVNKHVQYSPFRKTGRSPWETRRCYVVLLY